MGHLKTACDCVVQGGAHPRRTDGRSELDYPEDVEKPADARIKSGRYIKQNQGMQRNMAVPANIKTLLSGNVVEWTRKDMHLTEGRNTGFRKIRNALHNNGSPEPLFETDEERTYFSTTLYVHPDFEKNLKRSPVMVMMVIVMVMMGLPKWSLSYSAKSKIFRDYLYSA